MESGMQGRGALLSTVIALAGVLLWSIIYAASIQMGDLAPLNQPDGILNAGDVVVMQRFVLGQLQPTQNQLLAADVAPLNQPDGQINAGDLVVLMRAVTGQVALPSINVPSGGFAPPYLIPPNNQIRQSLLTVYGVASPQQSVNLYVNGTIAASLTADSLGNFQSTVNLQEGPNSFYAVGFIGAFESESSNVVSAFYDTSLLPVNWQKIVVTDLGSGKIKLTAQPGTVAAGMAVTLISKAGGTQTITSNNDGSFSATLVGSGVSEPVTITVDDGAGHRSLVSGNQAVGALSGTFLVNETGAATYTIPIEVPPGIAGMQPELSFNYNSQSGNGLLGVGWGLSGLSAVTRCPKTYAQDAVYDGVSYDINDRFCLDGQRLVNVSGSYGAGGTVYRTEVDSFSLITQNGVSCGGPCGFTVQTKSGQTVVYGNSDNTRQNVSTTLAATQWAINSITDAKGNSIRFEYYKNTSGDHRIKQITYTFNQNTASLRAVEFIYDPNRPDYSSGYVAGTLVTNTQRLQTVRTKIGTQTVKEYRLLYGKSAITKVSRIESIQECAFALDNSSQCTPPTKFQWAERSTVQLPTSAKLVTSTGITNSRWVGDFDGDGRQEQAALSTSSNSIKLTGVDNGAITFKDWPVSTAWGGAGYTWSGDFNGDGRMDIASASGSKVFMKLSTGSGFNSTTWTLPDSNWGAIDYTWAADFNGDGRTDIASAIGSTIYLRLSNGNGFDSKQVTLADGTWGSASYTWVGDFNGDGLSDIASASGADVYVRLSTGTGFTSTKWTVPGILGHWGAGGNTWAKDVNGDGITDLLTVSEINELDPVYGVLVPVAYVYVMESMGSGFVLSSYRMDMVRRASRYNYLEDINADGLMDLIIGFGNLNQTGVSEVSFGLRTGGFGPRFAWNGWDPGNDPNRNTYIFADFDGDGFLDSAPYLAVDAYWAGRFALSSAKHDVITNITPGLGPNVSATYKMLSDSYTSTACPGYPIVCTPPPVQVVSNHSVDDGIGGVASYDYTYSDIRIHMRGRGFLGFNSTGVVDNQTNVNTVTYFANDTSQTMVDTYPDRYPYAGMVSKLKTLLPHVSLKPINYTITTFTSMQVDQFALKQTTAGTYFPYARIGSESQYEISGAIRSTTTTTMDYDTYGNTTQVTAQTAGNAETFTVTTVNQYDPTRLQLGRLTRSTATHSGPGGIATRTSAFTYYPDGLLKSESIEPDQPDTSPLKQTTSYEYDTFGNKIKTTVTALSGDSATSGLESRVTQTLYDAFGLFPIKSINALGHMETYQYDARFGLRTQLTGPNQLTTFWEYDAMGRRVRESRADGNETTATIAWCPAAVCPNGGTQLITTTAGAPRTVVYKDAQGREIRSETEGLQPGSLIVQDTVYDVFGRVSRKSRPYYPGDTPQWATFTYDKFDRVLQENSPDGAQVTHTYTLFTKVLTTTIVGGDVPQISRTETYDAMNRLRQVAEEGGITTIFGYDALDHQVSVTDIAGNVTALSYDLRGRKISMDDPDMGHWVYRYNGFGNLMFQQDNKLQQVTLAYDPLGRMISRSESEGTSTWSYDTAPHGLGKLARIDAPNNYRKDLNYDALGRPVDNIRQLAGQSFTVGFTYDRFGRLANTSYPSGFATKNLYNSHGYLIEVRNAANDALYWQANAMTADGQITQETLGNGLITIRSYDPASGRIQQITTGNSPSSSAVQNLAFVFDTLGNLQSRTRNEGTTNLNESFTYDGLNRLTAAAIVGVGTRIYAYNNLGNIAQKGTATDYRYAEKGAGPHAVTFAGGMTYAYDSNGNLTSGAGRTISWNSSNKPILIQKGQTTVRFDYGPDRARTRQIKTAAGATTTTFYIGKLYEQIGTGTQTERKHYIIAGGKTVAVYSDKGNGSTRYLHHDHLGSVDVISNETGVVVERLSFSPFGARRNANWSDAAGLITSAVTSRGFTGHEQLDEVGLVHMNGRIYDPLLGRFLSADPQIQFAGASQSYNRYSYVLNNPLSFTDPSGFGLFSKLKKGFKKLFKKTPGYLKWGSIFGNSFVKKFFRSNPLAGSALRVAGAFFGQAAGAAFTSAYLTDINGGSLGDTLRSGAVAFYTAKAFTAVGNVQPGLGAKIVLHGTVGGLSSVASGGGFRSGFIAAGVTAGINGKFATKGRIFGTIRSAVAGGLGAKLGGGKFANGATTGAFSYLFNDLVHSEEKFFRLKVVNGEAVTKIDRIGSPVWGGSGIGAAVDFIAKRLIGRELNVDIQFQTQKFGEFELREEISVTTLYDINFRSLSDFDSEIVKIGSPVLTGNEVWVPTGRKIQTRVVDFRICPIVCTQQ